MVLKVKAERRMMLKLSLRDGMVTFQIEMERWHGAKRVGKECDSGEVEDVGHWLLEAMWQDKWGQSQLGMHGDIVMYYHKM